MEGTLRFLLVLSFVAVYLATNEGNAETEEANSDPEEKVMTKKANEEDDYANVEVVQDGKDESSKQKKVKEDKESQEEKEEKAGKKYDDTHHSDEDDKQEDDEEEEEEDPNAQIEVRDLYVPKDCENKSKSGDLVVIHYTGWLDDGSLFDTTVDPNKGYMPFEFLLGTGTVIKGFERGVLNMCKGMKREIVIPPSLGYGKNGAGDIPGTNKL